MHQVRKILNSIILSIVTFTNVLRYIDNILFHFTQIGVIAYGRNLLLRIISVVVNDEGCYKTTGYLSETSNHNNNNGRKEKEKAVTDLTSEDTLDYIYVSDAMYPRLSGQGCYQNTQQTISYET